MKDHTSMNTLFRNLLLLFISNSSALALDFLPGELVNPKTKAKILTQCAHRDLNQTCDAYYFYYSRLDTMGQPTVDLITPVAFSLKNLQSLKEGGFYYSAWSDKEPLTLSEFSYESSADYLWAPLYAAVDLVAGAIGTPFYLIFKSLNNIKYHKLMHSISNGNSLKISRQAMDTLAEDLCQMGFNSVYTQTAEALGHIKARKRVKPCGVLETP